MNLLNNATRFHLKRSMSTLRQLNEIGILPKESQTIHHNLDYSQIREMYPRRGECTPVNTPYGKVQMVDTGKYTGRSPKDKWLVANSQTSENIWWGEINQRMVEPVFNELYDKCTEHINTLNTYFIFDGHCGANPKTQRNVRFVTEYLWQHHFVKNMFIESTVPEDEFTPDFTIINACNVTNPKWQQHQLHSDIFIAFNI